MATSAGKIRSLPAALSIENLISPATPSTPLTGENTCNAASKTTVIRNLPLPYQFDHVNLQNQALYEPNEGKHSRLIRNVAISNSSENLLQERRNSLLHRYYQEVLEGEQEPNWQRTMTS